MEDVYFLPVITGLITTIVLSTAALITKKTVDYRRQNGRGTVYLFRNNRERRNMSTWGNITNTKV